MFETEDMLPRPPPKPSAPPLANEGVIGPTVPEVSIIFGKQANANVMPQISTAQQPTSYADWKKQVLPRVSYPSSELRNEINSNVVTTRSTVYPLRTTARILTTAPQATAVLPQTQNLNIGPIYPSYERNYQPNLENQNVQAVATSSLNSYTQSSEQRRSVDSLYQRNSTFPMERVLTICASTQTDFQTSTNLINDNLKHDFGQVINAVKELQEEQRQMRQLFEALMMQLQTQQQEKQQVVSNIFCCDMATQCEILKDNALENVPPTSQFQIENVTAHQALPSNIKIYSPTVRPTAQSTQYRTNTPLNTNKKQTPVIQNVTTNNQFATVLPKPSTEQSMVMNELALKYLPSEKLNELTATTTPLREIDNFTKAPTDISTASFRYLRKYRLLPQQQNQQNANSTPPQNGFHTPPTYNQHYQQNSPINIVGNSNCNDESPHLDLEHIRRQPKFL